MDKLKDAFKNFKLAAEVLDKAMLEAGDEFTDECNGELQSSNECVSDIADWAGNAIATLEIQEDQEES